MMFPRKIELEKIDDRTWARIGDLGENLRKQESELGIVRKQGQSGWAYDFHLGGVKRGVAIAKGAAGRESLFVFMVA